MELREFGDINVLAIRLRIYLQFLRYSFSTVTHM